MFVTVYRTRARILRGQSDVLLPRLGTVRRCLCLESRCLRFLRKVARAGAQRVAAVLNFPLLSRRSRTGYAIVRHAAFRLHNTKPDGRGSWVGFCFRRAAYYYYNFFVFYVFTFERAAATAVNRDDTRRAWCGHRVFETTNCV